MINIIPAPRSVSLLDPAPHVINSTVCCENAEWRKQVEAFRDIFLAGREIKLADGIGGIEIYLDKNMPTDGYRLDSRGEIKIYASSGEGVCYGLSTALQLCTVKSGRLEVPSVIIEDSPDKDYRSLMVDLGREWHPFGKLLKFVDLCFFYKIRYLNLHFADNKLYTLPSDAFPKLNTEGKHYTKSEILTLREYAAARGIVIVPEFECPGHAPVLNAHYPEVFGDRGDGEGGVFHNESGDVIDNSALLCASRESALEGVKTLIREICELFPEAPYLHIGGDEASIQLWDQCRDCREYMKKHGIEDVHGLYSDYVARITRYVLSLGKTPIVWEGFPEKGHEKIPKETVVISWENHYQTTYQLINEGFQIINASWKPLYIVPVMASPSPKFSWNAESIFNWSVYNWQHWWEKSVATEHPITLEPTEQVKGAMLCAWEMTFEQEITMMMSHLAALSERCWSVDYRRDINAFRTAFYSGYLTLAKIIQDK